MSEKSLDDVLNNFEMTTKEASGDKKPITFWIPENYKIKYDDIQKKSNSTFGKKIRELVLIAIDKTSEKTS